MHALHQSAIEHCTYIAIELMVKEMCYNITLLLLSLQSQTHFPARVIISGNFLISPGCKHFIMCLTLPKRFKATISCTILCKLEGSTAFKKALLNIVVVPGGSAGFLFTFLNSVYREF